MMCQLPLSTIENIMNVKLKTPIIVVSLSLIATGCASHNYYPNDVVHQNVNAASSLLTGMTMNEVESVMGAQPIRVDRDDYSTVWQYCDTQYDQSTYVALTFANSTNLLEKRYYYPITWRESKGEYLFPSDHGQAEIHTENLQISCEHFAQQMGIKDPDEIRIGGFSEQELDENRRRIRRMVDAALGGSGGGNEQERIWREQQYHR